MTQLDHALLFEAGASKKIELRSGHANGEEYVGTFGGIEHFGRSGALVAAHAVGKVFQVAGFLGKRRCKEQVAPGKHLCNHIFKPVTVHEQTHQDSHLLGLVHRRSNLIHHLTKHVLVSARGLVVKGRRHRNCGLLHVIGNLQIHWLLLVQSNLQQPVDGRHGLLRRIYASHCSRNRRKNTKCRTQVASNGMMQLQLSPGLIFCCWWGTRH
mmetsp:Transcript_58677/g.139708  ORF Transcript_58677/g.139708 Transcript_58677/m.139708 type:complete len:211 (+) Transcript_58677:935-1567(+)